VLYKIYYRIYFILFGVQIINHPKPANPQYAIPCESGIDQDFRRHNSFLYTSIKPKKWFFWKRKFAFKRKGTGQWYAMPSLTPWSYIDGIAKFGLNSTFVQKHIGENLEFVTW